MANQSTAAMAPRKLRVQTAVRQLWLRIRSLDSCRVAAMTRDTAAKIGSNHNKYSIDIAICLLLAQSLES